MSGFIVDPFRFGGPLGLSDLQLADGAILAMPFQEMNTDAPIDITGNHTPVRVGTTEITSISDGPLGGRAYRFASPGGNDARIEVPDHALLDTGDVFSLECYFRPVATTGTNTLISKFTSPGSYALYRTSDRLEFNKSQVAEICDTTGVVMNTTTHWYHIVLTKNGATVKIWVDAVDRTGTVTNATIENNSQAFRVGIDGLGAELSGDMALIAVYPTALSSTQVADHFAATTP